MAAGVTPLPWKFEMNRVYAALILVSAQKRREKKKTKPNTQGLFMKTHTTTGINTHTHTNGNSAMSYLLDNRLEEEAGLN